MQLLCFVASWYSPAAHGVHDGCFSSALNVPAAQSVAESAPAGQKVPAPHTTQSSSLVIMPEAVPSLPAGQSWTTLAPSTQKAPSLQARHAVAP